MSSEIAATWASEEAWYEVELVAGVVFQEIAGRALQRAVMLARPSSVLPGEVQAVEGGRPSSRCGLQQGHHAQRLGVVVEAAKGLAKHNGPLKRPPGYFLEYDAPPQARPQYHASAEAQVAAISDDMAYHSHDLDDGLRARMFSFDDIAHLPVVGPALKAARMSSLDVPPPRLRHETIRRVINAMITDVVIEIPPA